MNQNKIIVSNPTSRVSAVGRLVSPLRPERNGHKRAVAIESILSGKQFVLAARELKFGASYREWLFQTTAEAILAQYFEEWASDATGTNWLLCQACLHLFRRPKTHEAPVAVLSIHCEPGHVGASVRDKCKRGPHVHVDAAGYPIKKAHFPLNFGHLENVLGSMSALANALGDALQIAVAEVVRADWK